MASISWADTLLEMLRFTLPEIRLPVNWVQASSVIGSSFPDDYRRMIDKLGPGEIGDEIVVKAPGLYTPDGDLFWHSNQIVSGLESAVRTVGSKALPEGVRSAKSLLSWGYSPSGATFFWITDGDPEKWPIAVASESSWRVMEYGIAEFIVRFLREEFSLPYMVAGGRIERIYFPAPVKANMS